MKKNLPSSHEYEDVINLSELLRKLYDGKFKLILIIIFSILLGIAYITNQQKKNTFEFTLSIEPSHYSGFINIIPVTNYLYDNLIDNNNEEGVGGYVINDYKKLIFNSFMNELMDYEEVISVLEKKKFIKEKISLLTKQKREIALHNYAKSFYIQEIKDKNDKTKIHHYLKYSWHNKDEGIEILDEILKLTINNLEKSFFTEMDELLQIKRNKNAIEKLKRIDYLMDQSEIARELGISENSIDTISLAEPNVVFNISKDVDVYYYLRGFKMIDKEIALVKNRKDRYLENAEEQIQEFKNKKQIEWIKYNVNLIGIKSLKAKSIKILIIFVISGLVLGIFYISISTSNLFLKIRKNK